MNSEAVDAIKNRKDQEKYDQHVKRFESAQDKKYAYERVLAEIPLLKKTT